MPELLPYYKEALCEKCGHTPALTEHHVEVNQRGDHSYNIDDPRIMKLKSCSRAIFGTEWPTTRQRELSGSEIKHYAEMYRGSNGIPPTTESYQVWEIPEHLHRICPNCRWEWAEGTLDMSHLLGGPRNAT